MRYIGRIKDSYREGGLAGVGMLFAGRALYPHLYYERSLFVRVSAPAEPIDGLTWVTLPDELAMVAENSGRRMTEILSRVSRGAHCAAIFEPNGRCIAVRWVAPFAYDENDIRIALPKDGVWFFDAWTDPTYRGQGLSRQLLRMVLYDLRQYDGITQGFGRVDTTNKPSIAAWKGAGAEIVGKVEFLRAGERVWAKGRVNL